MNPNEVLAHTGIDEFHPIEISDDRVERWAAPFTTEPACGPFCGLALHQVFSIWYGAPTASVDREKSIVRSELSSPLCADCVVKKVGPYDEYVTLEKDGLVAYWFPLSITDWSRARTLVEERYGPASSSLPKTTLTVAAPGEPELAPFSYDGSVWFGPSTTIYLVTEQYSSEATVYKLGYMFYLSSLFDLQNAQRIKALVAHREKEKQKAATRDEDFVKAVVE
ncbi:MAG: hypothetical protein HYT87_18030 [Nitrospirae bacterium]|nr:hypothetical protein [Nitrospirota bacterium]